MLSMHHLLRRLAWLAMAHILCMLDYRPLVPIQAIDRAVVRSRCQRVSQRLLLDRFASPTRLVMQGDARAVADPSQWVTSTMQLISHTQA